MSTKEFSPDMFLSGLIMYAKILGFLLVLTGITFLQPLFVPLEVSGTVFVQLMIAAVKAFLVIAYYMHLKYESLLFKGVVYFAGAILMIFFIIVGIDSTMDDSKKDMFQSSMSHDSSKSH